MIHRSSQQLKAAGQFLDLEGRAVALVQGLQALDDAACLSGIRQSRHGGQTAQRERFIRRQKRRLDQRYARIAAQCAALGLLRFLSAQAIDRRQAMVARQVRPASRLASTSE